MRRQALVGLALVVIVALAGCSSGPIDAPATETPTETTPAVPPAIDNETAETYHFTYDATLTNSGGPLNVTAEGAVNRTARRLSVNYTYDEPIDRRVTVVAIDNDTYAFENDTWREREESVDWAEADTLGRQQAIWAASNVSTTAANATTNETNETDQSTDGTEGTTARSSSDTETVTLNVSNRTVVEDVLRADPFGLEESVFVTNLTYRITRERDGPITGVSLRAIVEQSNQEGRIDATLTFADHGEPVRIHRPEIATE